jgi:hypothetical protein
LNFGLGVHGGVSFLGIGGGSCFLVRFGFACFNAFALWLVVGSSIFLFLLFFFVRSLLGLCGLDGIFAHRDGVFAIFFWDSVCIRVGVWVWGLSLWINEHWWYIDNVSWVAWVGVTTSHGCGVDASANLVGDIWASN